MHRSWKGRGAACPESEVLGKCQQLTSLVSFEPMLIWSPIPGISSCSTQKLKGRDAAGQKNFLYKMELPFHMQLSWKKRELSMVRNTCLICKLNVTLKDSTSVFHRSSTGWELHFYYLVPQAFEWKGCVKFFFFLFSFLLPTLTHLVPLSHIFFPFLIFSWMEV